ncbi:hypothetical protein NA78x_005328 [Anatilimnocola sp. NA78]|uniref:hypothetical protein n=1 Tax=Anatilimnocola sp. NA78 TaxID=3415683 RepID=UPI003CE46EE8
MSEPSKALGILRSFGAVLAAIVFIVFTSTFMDMVMHGFGVFPKTIGMNHWQSSIAFSYRIVIGVIGSYLAATLARDGRMLHALIPGIIGTVVCTIGAAFTLGQEQVFGPAWYPIALAVTALPCAWLGGMIQRVTSAPGFPPQAH